MPRPYSRTGLLGAAAAASGLICLGTSGPAQAAPLGSASAAGSAAVASATSSGTSSAPRSAFDPRYDAGAHVPGLVAEYLATGPNARTDGTVIGPDYTQGTLASEAVGREAVQLTAAGQSVQFTLGAAANAIDVDCALPQGTSGTLAVYVNGRELAQKLQLTAAYSYIDTPQIYGSKTHHFFNDTRLMFGFELHRGDTVRLQAETSSSASSAASSESAALPITVNLADFYQVAPPRRQPAHTVSVLAEGADPTGATDSTAAFAAALRAASRSTLRGLRNPADQGEAHEPAHQAREGPACRRIPAHLG